MTISNILEHWASIYKPLSHNPESDRLEDQSFFRIRYIDLESIFSRNANIIHSPCLLYSVASTGELVSPTRAVVSHQIWFLAKLKDSSVTLGRYSGAELDLVAQELCEHCEQLISWLFEVKRTGICPVTQRSFADDAQLMQELQSINSDSFSWGVMPDVYSGQWLIAGLDWKALRPLYKFSCGSNGKYIEPNGNDVKE